DDVGSGLLRSARAAWLTGFGRHGKHRAQSDTRRAGGNQAVLNTAAAHGVQCAAVADCCHARTDIDSRSRILIAAKRTAYTVDGVPGQPAGIDCCSFAIYQGNPRLIPIRHRHSSYIKNALRCIALTFLFLIRIGFNDAASYQPHVNCHVAMVRHADRDNS
ncbi:hypothetical protein, partial [Paraburkholderia kururiensis]|uniref:hypothetical protein n=1 Tax=Paraburkholderia kururiensis TaxID=984307 RepID=UPI001E3BC3B9